MKKILILMALSGMLMPALASAELNYNAVDAGYSTEVYKTGEPILYQKNLGISKSVSGNVYLAASYEAGSQPGYSHSGEKKTQSFLFGAGYHTPLLDTLKTKVDALVRGNIVRGRAKIGEGSVRETGYDFGAGIRAQLAHGLECSLAGVHSYLSEGAYSYTNTFLDAQIGFNFTQKMQMKVGFDLLGHDQTVNVGLRFFY
jgi:hypothetical protein